MFPRDRVVHLGWLMLGCLGLWCCGGEKEDVEPDTVGVLRPADLERNLVPLMRSSVAGERGTSSCNVLFAPEFRRLCEGVPTAPLERVVADYIGAWELRMGEPEDRWVLRISDTRSDDGAKALVEFLGGDGDLPRGPQVKTREVDRNRVPIAVAKAPGFYEEKRLHWRDVNLRMVQHSMVVRQGRVVFELRHQESIRTVRGVISRAMGPADDTQRQRITHLMARIVPLVSETLRGPGS